MSRKNLTLVPVIALCLSSMSAWADEAAPAPSSATGIGIGVKAGSLGLGLDLSKSLTSKLDLRLSLNQYDFDQNGVESDISYDMNLQWKNTGLMLDWHPFGGGFRLSAGYVLNSNKISLTAQPTGATYTIDGTAYPSSLVGSLTGEVKFANGGYLGIGYGKGGIREGFGFTFELGVLYQGSPKVSLSTSSSDTGVQNAVQNEQAQAADSMKDYKLYPQIAVGVSYGF